MEPKETKEAPCLEAQIPMAEEVRTWAMGAVGVDPDYAFEKWSQTNENHGWIQNGRLIDWRQRFKRYWESDRDSWSARKNRTLASGKRGSEGSPPAPFSSGLVDLNKMRVLESPGDARRGDAGPNEEGHR